MILDYSNEGQVCDKDQLIQKEYKINDEKDFQRIYIKDRNRREEIEKYEYTLNFVGFLINSNNEIFAVFPKNYRVTNTKVDSAKLFHVLSKHIRKKPDMYIGSKYGEILNTNYPFAPFFGIYDYFSKYGLYFEDKTFVKPNIGGKVNWKETINSANKYLTNGKVSFHPIYFEKKYYLAEFLTECMIYAIDYTLDKFGMLIELEKTGRSLPNINLFSEKEMILERLYSLRQQVFKDYLIELIDHLINFFNELNQGGEFHLKHYSFASIWEDMVDEYLKYNFSEIKDDKIVFNENKVQRTEFEKKRFFPNLANTHHYFEPDYYYAKDGMQLIFDAKYYTESKGIDYKQIAYYLFLKEYWDYIESLSKYSKTYSALILPSENRKSEVHFKMDPLYNKTYENLIISEEYLDIRVVINFYLHK